MSTRRITFFRNVDGSDGLDGLSSYYRGRSEEFPNPSERAPLGDSSLYIESSTDEKYPDAVWHLGGINNAGGLVPASNENINNFMSLMSPNYGNTRNDLAGDIIENPYSIRTLTGGVRSLPRSLLKESLNTSDAVVARVAAVRENQREGVPGLPQNVRTFYDYIGIGAGVIVDRVNDQRQTQHSRVMLSRYLDATKELDRTSWLRVLGDGSNTQYDFNAERKVENTARAITEYNSYQEANNGQSIRTVRELIDTDLMKITEPIQIQVLGENPELDEYIEAPRFAQDLERQYRRFIVFQGIVTIVSFLQTVPLQSLIDLVNQGLFRRGYVQWLERQQQDGDLLRLIITDAVEAESVNSFVYNQIDYFSTFAKDKGSRNFWNQPQNFQIPFAEIDPEYTQYVGQYEQGIAQGQEAESQIVETHLPNVYAVNLYQEDVRRQPDRRIPGLRNGADYLKMATYNVSRDTELGRVARSEQQYIYEYYAAIGNYLRQGSRLNVPGAGRRSENIIVPATENDLLERVKSTRNIYPMHVDVSFDRSPYARDANGFVAAGVIYENNISVNVLENLRKLGLGGLEQDAPEEFVAAVSYIDSRTFGGEDPSPTVQRFVNNRTPLETYDLEDVFEATNQSRIDATVFSMLDLEPRRRIYGPGDMTDRDRENVATGLAQISNRSEIMAQNSYRKILNNSYGENTDTIGYRLRKRDKDDNRLIQTIMIGNTSGSTLDSSYIDTQIIYGKEYEYSLDEYRFVRGVSYSLGVRARVPLTVVRDYLGLYSVGQHPLPNNRSSYWDDLLSNQNNNLQNFVSEITFDVFSSSETPINKVVKIPLYDRMFYHTTLLTNARQVAGGRSVPSPQSMNGVVYPTAKIMDRPPTAPNMTVYPQMGNSGQIIVSMDLETGMYVGANAVPFIPVLQDNPTAQRLEEYQRQFENPSLPPGFLEFKNEGEAQIKNIILLRARQVDLNVLSYADLYQSFDPSLDTVIARKYTTNPVIIEEANEDINPLKSYDVFDNIRPNVEYYYTCLAEDIHGNLSNPSQIVRVRMVLDKGLLSPEISSVFPRKVDLRSPTKNLTEKIKIQASSIQTYPYLETNEDGVINRTAPNLGILQGESVKDRAFIVRLTSKDTGRKFDLKINFTMKVDGNNI